MTDEHPAELASRIGDLLIRAGIVTVEQMEDAVALALKMKLSFDRTLGMHGHLNAAGVQAALQLQEMIDSGQITLDSAVKVMELVGLQSMDFNTALRKLAPGIEKSQGKLTSKIGELMKVAGVVSPRNLDNALRQSLNTGLPLGLVLLGMGAITNKNLHSTLLALRLIRDDVIGKDSVVQALRYARLQNVSLKQALEEQQIQTLKMQFGVGELFVLAGFMTEGQLLSAQELELAENKTIGQILLECGYGSALTIEASLRLLEMVRKGTLFEDEAAVAFKRIRHLKTHAEMNEIFNNLSDNVSANPIDLDELITMTGLVSDDDFDAAKPLAESNKLPLVQILQQVGALDAVTVSAIKDCKNALDAGIISPEQGVIAVVYANENQTTLSETLQKFGWAPTVLMAD